MTTDRPVSQRLALEVALADHGRRSRARLVGPRIYSMLSATMIRDGHQVPPVDATRKSRVLSADSSRGPCRAIVHESGARQPKLHSWHSRFALPPRRPRSAGRARIRSSVRLISRASCTARLDGAETDATTGKSRHDRLLDDFKAAAPADQQDRIRKRHAVLQQRPADHFVHGVVPADIFAQDEQFALGVKSAAACRPPVRPKTGLRRTQRVGQRTSTLRVEPKIRIRRLQRSRAHRVDRRLAANSAARRREKMPPHFFDVGRRLGVELRAHHVSAIRVRFRIAGSAQAPVICSRRWTSPSVKRNPAASSRSWPGVRIVTLNGSRRCEFRAALPRRDSPLCGELALVPFGDLRQINAARLRGKRTSPWTNYVVPNPSSNRPSIHRRCRRELAKNDPGVI